MLFFVFSFMVLVPVVSFVAYMLFLVALLVVLSVKDFICSVFKTRRIDNKFKA